MPKKLGIKEGAAVALLQAPTDFAATLGELPADVVVASRLRKHHDVIVTFVSERARLEQTLPKLGDAIFPDGAVWVAWPKKASRLPTDITENTVRDVCLPLGLVDVKVCAIDDTWSGLKLVWRKERRRTARP